MGILEKFKRRFGMAKRFKRETKVDMKQGIISDEYNVEEIAERVAEEDIEEIIPEGRKSKEEFLISKGLHDRPNSHMAIKAWEDYQDSFYDM